MVKGLDRDVAKEKQRVLTIVSNSKRLTSALPILEISSAVATFKQGMLVRARRTCSFDASTSVLMRAELTT